MPLFFKPTDQELHNLLREPLADPLHVAILEDYLLKPVGERSGASFKRKHKLTHPMFKMAVETVKELIASSLKSRGIRNAFDLIDAG